MRANKLWTIEEEGQLKEEAKKGKSNRDIAILLGRSLAAVTKRRRMLEPRTGPQIKRSAWTAAEEEKLEEMFNDAKSDEDIAIALNRSLNAVKTRRNLMKLFRRERNQWTKEEESRLQKLMGTGKSREEIAKELGRSRMAINSKVNRGVMPQTSGKTAGLSLDVEPLKKGQDYLVKTMGTGMLKRQESLREIVKYKGKTDHLLIFERENYIETYTKVDVALGEVDIREATKTDYQTIQ